MPSSRYQSKVLQFVAQQSMKLRDRAAKGVRQLQVAATWGTQMVLYPFYAIFQSSRLVGKQLNQTARQIFPKLTAAIDPDSPSASTDSSQPLLPPESDRPIENVLNVLESALQLATTSGQRNSSQDEFQNPKPVLSLSNASKIQNHPQEGDRMLAGQSTLGFLPSTQPTIGDRTPAIQDLKSKIQNRPVQGIATLLEQRQIVLVDTDNQVHNVLTMEQQVALQQRIVLEVASYWRDRREFTAFDGAGSPLGRRFLPLPKERKTMLPPVRYLRRFIAWMQTSPVAIATNVFQESALVPTQQGFEMAAANGFSPNTFGPNSAGLNGAGAGNLGLNMGSTSAFFPLEPSPNLALPSSSGSATPATSFLPPLYPDLSTQDFINSALRSSANGGGMARPSGPRSLPSNSLSPNSIPGKRRSWLNKLVDWIVNPAKGNPGPGNPGMGDAILGSTVPNLATPNGAPSPDMPMSPPWPAHSLTAGLGQNQDLAQNQWFDPDNQGEGWFNSNQINQVRRQREFPPVVPSLPARVRPNLQSSSLNASYANIEANLTEMTEAGLITTPGILNEADMNPLNPFPESAAAFLNTPGTTPDPVSLETYLAHHGAAYDFRRTEAPSVDRNVLYRVSADAQTSVHSDAGEFALDIPGQPRGGMTNTWLDTTAEVVGYEKHPLERLLGWVDLGMAWIERRIANAWFWVRDRF